MTRDLKRKSKQLDQEIGNVRKRYNRIARSSFAVLLIGAVGLGYWGYREFGLPGSPDNTDHNNIEVDHSPIPPDSTKTFMPGNTLE